MLAGALESHWNSLREDEEYKKEINVDPTIFRMRSSSFEFAVVAIANALDAILVFLKISHHSQSSSLTFSQAV